MSLADLRSVLQAQADSSHAIIVSAATLARAGLAARGGLDDLVRGHLALGTADLAVSFTGEVPAPSGDSLTLSGTAVLLGIATAAVTVTFLGPATGVADVRVVVGLPAGWTLGTSFSALDRPPYSELTLTDGVYVLTTLPGDSYTWNGTTQPLVQGSQLLSLVALAGPLEVAELLLSGAPGGPVPLTGVLDPSGLLPGGYGIPALALTAPLGGKVGIPFFSLSAPRIELMTAPAPGPGLLVWLAFSATLTAEDTPLCEFSAFVSSGATEVTFVMSPLDPSSPAARSLSPEQMAELVHVDYSSVIPQELTDLFGAVTLRGLAATISLGGSFELTRVLASIGTSRPWTYGQFTLEELSLDLMAMAPVGTGPVLASFTAKAALFPHVTDGEFEVEATYHTDSGELTVGATFTGEIKLSKVVSGLSGGSLTLPDGLDVTFEDFGAYLDKPSGGTARYVFFGGIEAGITLPFLGTRVDGDLQVVVDSAARSCQLTGSLIVGDQAFSATVDLTGTDTSAIGTWQLTGDGYLGFKQLAQSAGIQAPPIPDGLDLGLKSAQLSYDFTHGLLAIEAESVNYGKAAFAAAKDASGEWVLAFGVLPQLEVKIDLTMIDVIGALVPSGDDIISLSGLRIVGATGVPSGDIPQAAGDVIGPVTHSGLMLSAELKVGTLLDQAVTVDFGGRSQDQPDQEQPDQPHQEDSLGSAATGPVPVGAPTPGAGVSPAPQAMWISVQRSFGPVYFERIGFGITPPADLSILLDASVTLAGLTIGLTGLQASVPIKDPFTPSFGLAGLQVQFTGGGVTISGGLEKVPQSDSSAPAEYTGDLTVQLPSFGITVLGSYTTVDGQPSLYAFLMLDAPLGGPAFFFVTGLAGGLGYNRRLLLPGISGVEDYPLVAGALGKLDRHDTEQQLNAYIPAAQNENWLAAGVRFTSFEMMSSFALLTVAFGAQVEIALLGESVISVPAPAAGETVTPVAQAVLVLTVDVSPASGQLAVCAQLTSRSYVLDQAARLTGGFAFYAWFAPSEWQGDFVVTLGGYNPYFTPPPHYPQQVPRLGLSWQVSSELAVTGGLYFALTPAALMAGGYLRATWESGDVSAWFDAQADFLMRFKPFQYLLATSITLGASVTVNLWVTTLRLTISVGVGLTLWGPPFGGTAVVHLAVISFTIGFGASQPGTLPDLSWDQFRQSFLPPASRAERDSAPRAPRAPLTAAVADADPTPTDSLVTVSAAQGLLAIVRENDTDVWVVAPAALRIAVTTQVPSTSASVAAASTVTPSGSWTDQLGVGPMGAGAGTLNAALTVTISGDTPGTWAAAASTGGVPKALYLSTDNQPQADGTIRDALLGLTLTPAPPTGGATLPVPVDKLLDDSPPPRGFGWSPVVPPSGDSFDQGGAMTRMQSSLTDSAVAQVRRDLLKALRRQGLDVAATVDVAGFADRAASVMAAPPQLRLLGEEVPPAWRGGAR